MRSLTALPPRVVEPLVEFIFGSLVPIHGGAGNRCNGNWWIAGLPAESITGSCTGSMMMTRPCAFSKLRTELMCIGRRSQRSLGPLLDVLFTKRLS